MIRTLTETQIESAEALHLDNEDQAVGVNEPPEKEIKIDTSVVKDKHLGDYFVWTIYPR